MSKKFMAAVVCSTALFALPAVAQTAKPDFITKQSTNEWRASKLVGVNVYGTDNKKIGDINDILVDQQGNAKAVVIGVGGFLGIGEKNVAVPFNALQWQNEGRTAASGSAPNASGASGANTGNTQAKAASRGYPDHAVLAMNKQQLQNAPKFQYASNTGATSSSGTSTSAPASSGNENMKSTNPPPAGGAGNMNQPAPANGAH